ncbi:thiazolylpeptide-type bacteriocin [Glycomyces sp. TRM65418]|uniref:thiazolylpeptide-type bacteriocin n=1 Tax=Glycomyces sp. TRM65418 TaxID=2867006 RepID=UPI001CE5D3A5|nr:thiazolylpeptide-type bacteriocin [Glycomyces sp. TRM65418]MCC3765516.1 thiazolylpeptide-type bacteriocin [Glycomyces sp. TRM65418]QZD55123.1 thiazolylpeptide-type bacteriocin [Glycomyces sp. TRM65418]
MNTQTAAFDFEGLDLDDLSFDAIEVATVRDAVALPETGASSASSSCDSCSCCVGCSCCSLTST